MADLEALSNKELRQKCIEYGMPNVPVTDSSRKILVKRLEAAMSGKPTTTTTTKAKNTRRETLHVTKPSEVSSSPKKSDAANKAAAANNRASRRTIAVPERHIVTTTTVSEPEYSDVSPDRVEGMRVKTNTPEKPPTLYPKLPTKEPSPKPQHLSKTGVVTTSYIQETTPVNKIYSMVDEVDLVEDFAEEEEAVKKTVNKTSQFTHVPISEPRITTSVPFTSNLSSSTRYSSLGTSNYNKPNYLSTTNVRTSYIPPSGGYSTLSGLQYNKRPYEEEVDESDDYEEDEEDEVVLVEESPIKDAETPFLSQFARNLEHLKATPMRHSIGPLKITPPKPVLRNRDVYNRRTIGTPINVNSRRSIKPPNDSSFRQFLLAMEEKYHLKHSLILISIFILAVFIYVFFIQSV